MTNFHCIKCYSDKVIYLGKVKKSSGADMTIQEFLGPYQYKCKNCGTEQWSQFKVKAKFKWYKEKNK